jgi:hypothetical protein
MTEEPEPKKPEKFVDRVQHQHEQSQNVWNILENLKGITGEPAGDLSYLERGMEKTRLVLTGKRVEVKLPEMVLFRDVMAMASPLVNIARDEFGSFALESDSPKMANLLIPKSYCPNGNQFPAELLAQAWNHYYQQNEAWKNR